MRAGVLFCVLLYLCLSVGDAGAKERPIVAVFDVEAKRIELPGDLLDVLSDHVATRLTETKKFQVIPREQLKKRLLQQKKDSYRSCYDKSCQIEMGRELAAQKTLASQVNKIGDVCTVNIVLYDLKKATTEKAASERGMCDEKGLLNSIDVALNRLTGTALPGGQRGPTTEAKGEAPAVEGMVYIGSGEFFMGCKPKLDSECVDDEKPGRMVYVDAFYIDRTEVTSEQYGGCVKAGTCRDPRKGWNYSWGKPNKAEHPINGVSWQDAKAYCKWAGKRLPTEAEWEKAARGDDGRKYPWGSQDISCDFAVIRKGKSGCGRRTTWSVCSRTAGNSPYGLCDVIGNLWEWVEDYYGNTYYQSAEKQNPRGPSEGKYKVIRGGSYCSDKMFLRISNRGWRFSDFRSHYIGFRCARSAVQ